MYYFGGGLASLVFAAVNLLPYGWRAIYVIGALPLFAVATLRRQLPETERFAAQESAASKGTVVLRLLRRLRELGRVARRARGTQAHAQALQADVATLQQRMAALATRAEAVTGRVARSRDTA